MRGIGEACEMCMWLALGGVGRERIGFRLYQSGGRRGSMGRVSVSGLGGVGGGFVHGLREWAGVMYV